MILRSAVLCRVVSCRVVSHRMEVILPQCKQVGGLTSEFEADHSREAIREGEWKVFLN